MREEEEFLEEDNGEEPAGGDAGMDVEGGVPAGNASPAESAAADQGEGEPRARDASAPEAPPAEEPPPRAAAPGNGARGYVYLPQTPEFARAGHWTPEPARKRHTALLVIALLIAALTTACCLIMAFRWASGRPAPWRRTPAPAVGTDAPDPDSARPDDPTDTGEDRTQAPSEDPEETGQSPSQPSTPGKSRREDIPASADIRKKPRARPDADGDGKAETETDADGEVISSAGHDARSLPTVVAAVSDSVVEIMTESVAQSAWAGEYIRSGAGSGVIIDRQGFIITNHHVIADARNIFVMLTDGQKYEAVLVGTDERTDIAVLWIDPKGRPLTVANLGSSFDLVVGEDVLAIGNPLGSLGGTVTEGIVSSTARDIRIGGADMQLLQVSAPINPGNSGGGLFNMAGDLVGVVNAKYAAEGVEGLGFAVPIDTAYPVILELIDHGYVKGRPTLDATFLDLNLMDAFRYFGSPNEGAYVWSSGYPELRQGDLVRSVNGHQIVSSAGIASAIDGLGIGDDVEIVVFRGGTSLTVTVKLIEDIPKNVAPAA